MTRDQIEAWAESGESETVEFKKSTGEKVEAVRTLCAMLNHRGGRVVFGVTDDRKVVGQQVSGSTIEHLVEEFKQIDPPAYPSVQQVPVRADREAIVVTVSAGAVRPYSCKGQPYKRVGNRTEKMSRDEYNRTLLERMHAETRWENEPATGWGVADLDANEILKTLNEAIRRGRVDDPGTREPTALLRGFGLTRNGQLLRAAVVLFGNEERVRLELPQCLLRVAKFRGLDKTEFLDNRQFQGNAFTLLARGERFLRENLPVAGRVVPNLFERIDDPLYPPVALREALANAICHRDYSIGGGSVAAAVYDDRLEVTSSGTLHFGLTPAALFDPHESLPWNPLVAQVFYLRGVIERWGRGTLKMAELTAQAGLPKPEIEDKNGCVTVRFRPSRYIPPTRVGHDLTERHRIILQLIANSSSGLSLKEILAGFDTPPVRKTIQADLQHLRNLGLVVRSGLGAGAKWRIDQPIS